SSVRRKGGYPVTTHVYRGPSSSSVASILSGSGPVDFTAPTRPSAADTLSPVAQAPIENPFRVMIGASGGESAVTRWRHSSSIVRWTSRSSAVDRTHVYGRPDEPDDSSSSTPSAGTAPCRQ